MKILELKIKGMTCDHCAATIKKQFDHTEGLVEKDVVYQRGTGIFTYDETKVSKEEIIQTIDKTGHYHVVGEIQADIEKPKQFDLIIIGGGSAAFSAAIKANRLGLSTLMVNAGIDCWLCSLQKPDTRSGNGLSCHSFKLCRNKTKRR
jgi:mercuric reductase